MSGTLVSLMTASLSSQTRTGPRAGLLRCTARALRSWRKYSQRCSNLNTAMYSASYEETGIPGILKKPYKLFPIDPLLWGSRATAVVGIARAEHRKAREAMNIARSSKSCMSLDGVDGLRSGRDNRDPDSSTAGRTMQFCMAALPRAFILFRAGCGCSHLSTIKDTQKAHKLTRTPHLLRGEDDRVGHEDDIKGVGPLVQQAQPSVVRQRHHGRVRAAAWVHG
jgi:hypothetical protein